MAIRFPKWENGVLYLITNWRTRNGKVEYSKGKCWKFPLKTKGKRTA